MIFSNILSVAALLLPGLVATAVYDRPLDIVYALEGGKGLPYSDERLLDYFDQVNPGITSMVPFFLNVADPSKYDSMVESVQKRNITIVPAVGGPPNQGNIDIQKYKDIAKGYKTYSEYIRLENMQGFYDEYGQTGIQNMIDYCVSIGFQHIMLNPWPNADGGGVVQFPNAECDATIYQVLPNWCPGNPNKIKAVQAYRPNVNILINYESPPQQDVLTRLEKNNAGASTAAMKTTIKDINGQYKSENLHWIPPMDQSYDPIALGTWNWIAAQLSEMGYLFAITHDTRFSHCFRILGGAVNAVNTLKRFRLRHQDSTGRWCLDWLGSHTCGKGPVLDDLESEALASNSVVKENVDGVQFEA